MLRLVVILIFAFSAGSAFGQTSGTDSDIQASVDKFNQAADRGDWETARQIGSDMRLRFGSDNVLVGAVTRVLESHKNGTRIKSNPTNLVKPANEILRTYDVTDLPFWTKKGDSISTKMIDLYLRANTSSIGESRIKIVPYVGQGAIIVNANRAVHKEISTAFESLLSEN